MGFRIHSIYHLQHILDLLGDFSSVQNVPFNGSGVVEMNSSFSSSAGINLNLGLFPSVPEAWSVLLSTLRFLE